MLLVLFLAVFPPTRVVLRSTPGSEKVETYVRQRLKAYGNEVSDDADGADLVLFLDASAAGRVVSLAITAADGNATREIHAADADEAQALTWLVVRGAIDRIRLVGRPPEVPVVPPPAEIGLVPLPVVAPPLIPEMSPVATPTTSATAEPASSPVAATARAGVASAAVDSAAVESAAVVSPARPPPWLRTRAVFRGETGFAGVGIPGDLVDLPLPLGFGIGVDVGDSLVLGLDIGWLMSRTDDVDVHDLPIGVRAEWRALPAVAIGVRAAVGPSIGVGRSESLGTAAGVAASFGPCVRLRLPFLDTPLPLAMALEAGVEFRALRPRFLTDGGAVQHLEAFGVPLALSVELDPPWGAAP